MKNSRRYDATYRIKTIESDSIEEFNKAVKELIDDGSTVSAITAVIITHKLSETP